MKKTSLPFVTKTVLAACLLAAPLIQGADFTWSGASGVNVFWNMPTNWLPIGTPGSNDAALFFNQGAVNNETTFDNVVTNNTTVHALRLGQTNGINNVFINPGVALTVFGTDDNGYGPLASNPNGSVFTNGFSTLYAGLWPGTNLTATTISSNTISGGGT